MPRKLEDLFKQISPDARVEVHHDLRQTVREVSLSRVRQARDLTQERLARALSLKQGDISRIERRSDMYVSTLANYIKAMGGALEIRAVFPDGVVFEIDQFQESKRGARLTTAKQALSAP